MKDEVSAHATQKRVGVMRQGERVLCPRQAQTVLLELARAEQRSPPARERNGAG